MSLSTLQAQEIVCKLLSGVPKEALDPRSVQRFVGTLRECAKELSEAAQIEESLAELVRDSVTQGSYPVLFLLGRGHLERACQLLVSIWKTTLEALERSTEPRAPEEGDKLKTLEMELESLSALNLAVSEVLRRAPPASILDANQTEARNILHQLARNLELSLDDLGRVFGVSGETVRRWARGTHRIPSGRIAQLISADGSLSRLLQMFPPDRLPQVIRREAELFGGERALDWILRGRHADVADRYEDALMYQA